jgi:hypothetical protein
MNTVIMIAVLAILIILALVVLTDFTSVPSHRYCVSSPLNELATTLSYAQGGLAVASKNICLKPREGFTSDALRLKVNNVRTLTFECDNTICGDLITISDWNSTTSLLTSNSDTEFIAAMTCKETNGADCVMEITEVKSYGKTDTLGVLVPALILVAIASVLLIWYFIIHWKPKM